MADFVTLDQINTIEFDSTHLWSIEFPDAPAPFNQWFPATSFDDDVYSIVTDQYDIGNEKFQQSTGLGLRSARIECFDADDARLFNWILKWVDTEMVKEHGMAYLEDYCKVLNVKKFNWQQKLIRQDQYIVTPIGSFKDSKTPEAGAKVLSFEVAIQAHKRIK